jgi:hypothetical protein
MNTRRMLIAGLVLAPAAPLAARAFRAEAVAPDPACGADCAEDRFHTVSGSGTVESEETLAPSGFAWRCPVCGRGAPLPPGEAALRNI